MGDEEKFGTHLAAVIQVLTFSFGAHHHFECNLFEIPTTMGVSSKKKVNTYFAAPFVSLSAQTVIKLEFHVIIPLLTGTKV